LHDYFSLAFPEWNAHNQQKFRRSPMIIWGWKGREIQQASGQFYCPQCNSDQPYHHLRVATYFTLYFIPLFETEHPGDYIKCRRCSGAFKTAVLEYEPPSSADRILMSLRADLENGTPLEAARIQLVNAGMGNETAHQLVSATAGDRLLCCTKCDRTFVVDVIRCSICDGGLSYKETRALE